MGRVYLHLRQTCFSAPRLGSQQTPSPAVDSAIGADLSSLDGGWLSGVGGDVSGGRELAPPGLVYWLRPRGSGSLARSMVGELGSSS